LEFRVLGAVEAFAGGRPVDLGHARQRCVLAVLLAAADRPVSADQLMDRVWDGDPPQRGREALYSYLSRLRTTLADDAAIVRRSGGYVLVADPEAVDLHRFRRLASEARAADGGQAVELFDRALGLWRDTAFADLDCGWLNSVRAGLEGERRAAELDRTDAALRDGRHDDMAARLWPRAEENLLDERFAGQLMLALYRSGRQADALGHYQRVREALAEDLGADPGRPLRELHHSMLTSDPAIAAPSPGLSPARAAVAAAEPVPRQLPPAPIGFTGRDEELAALDEAVRAAAGGAVVITALAGMGGIGKTWLALHWAHRNAARFPDGQLFVDLQGFAPADRPMDPSAALRGFLTGLGVEHGRIPPQEHAQAALYRSLLADKRLLLVLDNAADAAQVEPLLPGSATCAVLITSRDRLTSLLTRHGARLLRVEVLEPPEARALLAERIGAQRIDAEPEAVDALLAACGGLPLALGVVAARAVQDPRIPLARLAAELGDEPGRMDALADEDPAASLPAVLSWSLRALTEEQTRLFALLGVAPGRDLSVAAAAALADLPPGQAATQLRALEQASLLERDAESRYRMHDLVRLHARQQTGDAADAPDRDAAFQRIVDFYLHTAYAGRMQLYQHSSTLDLDPPAPGSRPLPLPDLDAATDWFDAEHANLLATTEALAERGQHRAVWQLAWTLTTYHQRRGRLHDDVALWQRAVTAAPSLGVPTAPTQAHRYLGLALARIGEHDDARRHMAEALSLAVQTQDREGHAHAEWALAWASEHRGDDQAALEHARLALPLYQGLDNPGWEAGALNDVGWYSARVGEYATARTHCEAALALYREHGIRASEAYALDSLGYIEHHTGHHAESVDRYRQAVLLRRDLNDSYQLADALDHLGDPLLALGRPQQARTVWTEALELYREQGREAEEKRIRGRLEELPA
jgi:DNA-binding SARP family transcriptional activator